MKKQRKKERKFKRNELRPSCSGKLLVVSVVQCITVLSALRFLTIIDNDFENPG